MGPMKPAAKVRVMAIQKRRISRRSIVGFVLGLLVGFNLASWLSIPVPSRTDIEIEVIARDGGLLREAGSRDLIDVRVGSARVRHNNEVGRLKTGKDCDQELVYDSKDHTKVGEKLQNPKPNDQHKKHRKTPRDMLNSAKSPSYQEEDYHLEEEIVERGKLQVFYEDDIGIEDEKKPSSQPVGNLHLSPRYVNHNRGLNPHKASQSDAENTAERHVRVDDNRTAQSSNLIAERQNLLSNRKDVGDKHFLYIGVLTAQKYLATRGRAIMHTWGPDAPGTVEFYVGRDVTNVEDGEKPLPLVRLASVGDNVYPPQKKSFLMFKHMYDSYLDSGYQWFMRADDDVYIKTDKLERFLRRLNSSKPVFLGQTGLGNAEERGRLSLDEGDNYCMGGPGMIFSREVLRRVGPHIHECVKNLYSWHEDVELSRCVRRFADINCAWSYEMQELFYEHYYLRQGYIDPTINPHNPKLVSALTLHPNKNPAYQVKLHSFMRTRKIEDLFTRIKLLQRDVVDFKRLLGQVPSMEEHMLGLKPTLNRYMPYNRTDVLAWDFFTNRLVFTVPPQQARRSMPTHRQAKALGIIVQVMRMMNANSRSRGRVIDFKQVAYGYRRVNPLYGPEYVLDLLLMYKRYQGKKMTIPVRRHAYIQQTFGRAQFWENHPLHVHDIKLWLDNKRQGFVASVMSSLLKRSRTMMSLFGRLKAQNKERFQTNVPSNVPSDKESIDSVPLQTTTRLLQYDSRTFSSKWDATTVNIIVPLVGRLETFRNFMANLAHVSLSRGDPVSLLIVLFRQNDPSKLAEGVETVKLLMSYAEQYPLYDLRHIEINGEFSRGMALEIGASHFDNESLLFFCDVDVVFNSQFMQKCRANSVRDSSVYYPILFSEYYPRYDDVLSAVDKKAQGAAFSELHDDRSVRESQRGINHFNITKHGGYWRNYGYGLLCVYKSDFVASGGFDLGIQGWGLEDVNLIDKFVGARSTLTAGKFDTAGSLKKHRKKTLHVVRTADPSLVHVYHTSHCNRTLAENQLRMCLASRASGIASASKLAEAWRRSGRTFGPSNHTVNDVVSEISPLSTENEVGAQRKHS